MCKERRRGGLERREGKLSGRWAVRTLLSCWLTAQEGEATVPPTLGSPGGDSQNESVHTHDHARIHYALRKRSDISFSR